MLWILIEVLIALALVIGIVVWVMLPPKKRRGAKSAAPVQSSVEERKR